MTKKEKPDFNKLMSRASGGVVDPIMPSYFAPNLNNTDDIHTLLNDDINNTDDTATSYKTESIDSNSDFKPHISISNSSIKNETDKDIENKIATIILTAIASIQTKYEENSSGDIIQVKYFDKKNNSSLLRNTFENVCELVNKLNRSSNEKDSYFNNVITKFIEDRLLFISMTCLESHCSPNDVENAMKTFLQIDKRYISSDILDMYFERYYTSCVDIIYSRIGRTTVYMSELLSEALDIKKRVEGLEMSFLINDLLIKNIDEQYIEQAKKNLQNRKPVNEHYPKRIKSELQREKRRLKIV